MASPAFSAGLVASESMCLCTMHASSKNQQPGLSCFLGGCGQVILGLPGPLSSLCKTKGLGHWTREPFLWTGLLFMRTSGNIL